MKIKTIQNLEKFRLTKEEQKDINGGITFIYRRHCDGEIRSFDTDNRELGSSWLTAQASLDRLACGGNLPSGYPAEPAQWPVLM